MALVLDAARVRRAEDPGTGLHGIDWSAAIPYRTLERADFRGTEAPPEFAAAAAQLNAATCAVITTLPRTRIVATPIAGPGGTTRYRATLQNVGFEAQMLRSCSWWNPQDLGVPEAYILQHEQIHFALFELEARRLHGMRNRIEAHLSAEAGDPHAATQAAQALLDAEVRKGGERVLLRSRRFDEDTSMGHHPRQQQRWWEQVQAELAERPTP